MRVKSRRVRSRINQYYHRSRSTTAVPTNETRTSLVAQSISHRFRSPTHCLTPALQLSLHISLFLRLFVVIYLSHELEKILNSAGENISTRQNQKFTLWITSHLPFAIEVLGIAYIIIVPFLYRRNYGWEISDHAIFVRSGWFFIAHTVIFHEHITKISITRTFGDRCMRTARIGVRTTLWKTNIYLLCCNITEAKKISEQLHILAKQAPINTDNTIPVSTASQELHAKSSIWWLRFAPVSIYGYFCLLTTIAYIVAICSNSDLFGSKHLTRTLSIAHTRYGLIGSILILLCTILIIYLPLSIVLNYIFMGNFRLYTIPNGYRSKKGLLWPRCRTITKDKILGTTVRSNLLLRLFNGARAYAIVRPGYLVNILSPSTTYAAHTVAADIAGDSIHAFYDKLFPTARASIYPREFYALGPLFLIALWWLMPAPFSAENAHRYIIIGIAFVFALWLAKDRFNNIGYGYTEHNLIIQEGSLLLRRIAIKRSLIIGWEFNQNPFQNLNNICTLWALTADERHRILDIDTRDAVTLIKECTPGFADEFLDQKIVNQPLI